MLYTKLNVDSRYYYLPVLLCTIMYQLYKWLTPNCPHVMSIMADYHFRGEKAGQ